MEFRILGPLEVRASGRAVEISGAKRRALLGVLVLEANRPVSTQRLALALWGPDAPPSAIKAVQVQVSRLRRALGETGVLETTPAGYRLLVGAGELDLERFERALAAGRRALAAGDFDRAAELLQGALRLWRRAPLEEFAWAPFAAPEIRRLEELRLIAVESRVEAELAAGRHAELVAELQRLTGEHPWRERLHAQLMLALYRSGRQADALAAYRQARAVMVGQLGIEPGAELHDIHEAVLAHDATLDAPTPALRRASALPAAPNRTIGRAADIGLLSARLRADETRLIPLTGPVGVGKTRLALDAARAVAADFADGTAFVSLAAVKRPADVAAAIIGALGIFPLSGESDEQAVERVLAAKHVLLVVDNCEHLLAAAPFLARLPASGRGVTVLATSREPLTVQAEQVYPVLPLALPEPGSEADLGTLASVAAVALFCERARAHDPGFGLKEEHASAVAAICRQLDGLPLAIELAAARCGLLSPAEIAARLHMALGTGVRDAPARQRTLRATLDWSHALLDADEQACFARFAVFTGGAGVPAAETITGAGVATLERLVAKSLWSAAPKRVDPPDWGCWKRFGPTRPNASPRCRTASRSVRTTSATTCRWRNAMGSTRRSTAPSVASISRAWTARSAISARLYDGRPSGARLAESWSWLQHSSTTGCGASAIRSPSVGCCPRSGARTPLAIQRCAPARWARCAGRCGRSGVEMSSSRCSRRPRRSPGR